MTCEEKSFPLGEVISVVTGVLVSRRHIAGVYDVLNWMTGEEVYTHQIPRISREAAPVLLSRHSFLAEVVEESKFITRDNWLQVLEGWEGRFGDALSVPKLTVGQHERIDPLSELAEKVHPDRIVIAKGSS